MTDEEKAEEILQTKGSMTFCAKGCGYTEKVKELIAIGIAEERKETAEKISVLEKENAELQKDKEYLDNTNNEQTKIILQLNEQIEKMKNFYNCKNSSRALCPNEHNCKGCKDWGLADE